MEEWGIFRNIGEKIKIVVRVWFVLECIASFIFAIVLFSNRYTLAYGLIPLICGPLVAWISSLALYGFADLIESTQLANKQRAEILKIMRSENFDDNMPTL